MIGQGNEPRWEQGGAQSAAAETCLPSGTERQTFVWQGDSPANLTSPALSQTHLSHPLIPRLRHSLTPQLFPPRHLHLPSLVSFFVILSLSLFLSFSTIPFLILSPVWDMLMLLFFLFNSHLCLLKICRVIQYILIYAWCSIFFPLFLVAGAHWWLFLWSGHQPAPRWFSAGNRSHSLHRNPGPHDFSHLLCLQWLLRSLCWHQEWASEEGKSWPLSLFLQQLETISAHFINLILQRVQAVHPSMVHRHCKVVLFLCRWVTDTGKRTFLIFNTYCQRVRKK